MKNNDVMDRKLYIGFKGKNNASCVLAEYLCKTPYLLTNSFLGLKKDIEQLDCNFDYVLMFGIDKNLKDTVRIDAAAQREGYRLLSALNLDNISCCLNTVGIINYISFNPTHYLCNEAYWFALQKFYMKVVFIHISSIKNIDEEFLKKMKSALC